MSFPLLCARLLPQRQLLVAHFPEYRRSQYNPPEFESLIAKFLTVRATEEDAGLAAQNCRSLSGLLKLLARLLPEFDARPLILLPTEPVSEAGCPKT
jgi:hypothetical protein